MTTWISDPIRAGLAGLAALTLSGCVAGGPEATAGQGGLAFSRAVPKSIRVAGDTVQIAGPVGFCVEDRATRDGDEGAFVLMASCAAVTGRKTDPVPRHDALLTASVAAQPGPGGRPEDRAVVLSRFFSSPVGRAALARDGRAESVAVTDMFDRDGLFFLHASDDSAGLLPGLSKAYWRAIFDVNGRIVTASVVGFEARPIGDAAGLDVLTRFAERIRAESVGLGIGAAPDPVAVAAQSADSAPEAAAGPLDAAPAEVGAKPKKRGFFGFLWR